MVSAYTSCVACSGSFESNPILLPNARVEICSKCGGLHYTVNPTAYDNITNEIRLVNPIANESLVYFDVSIYDGSGRFHGWLRSGFGFDHVIQLG
jgi:hypothetical protein